MYGVGHGTTKVSILKELFTKIFGFKDLINLFFFSIFKGSGTKIATRSRRFFCSFPTF